MSPDWLSELRGPELLLDLMGICLWHLKPESKADLGFINIFLPKEKISFVFSFTIRKAAEIETKGGLLKVMLLLTYYIFHRNKMRRLQFPVNQCLKKKQHFKKFSLTVASFHLKYGIFVPPR